MLIPYQILIICSKFETSPLAKDLKENVPVFAQPTQDCRLYFGGARTIQDFFEFLTFGNIYANSESISKISDF